jgi:hypothetical protein
MHSNRRASVMSILVLSAAASFAALPSSAQPFNGTLDFTETAGTKLEVAHVAALNPTNALTIEAWVRFTPSTGQICRSLVGKGFTTSYWFGICGSTFRTYTRGSGSNKDGGTVPTGVWTHLAMTTDGTTRRHYVNGALAGTFAEPTPGTPLPTNGSAFRIGNDVSWDYPPNGRMDEVRLWNVARTQADIQRTMRVAIDAPLTGLVSVWHLDGNGDDVIGSHDGTLSGGASFSSPPVGGFCVPTDTRLCLKGGRFAVTVSWKTPDAATGNGHVVPGYGDESGLFWYFNADNWELLIKALDGCPINNRKWVFTAATTNVEYDVTVRDLVTDQTKVYHNTQGVSAPAVTDTSAFATCP